MTDDRTPTPNLVYVVQRGALPDLSRPYPKFCDANGQIGRQDVWKGDPDGLLGFQRSPILPTIDLPFFKFRKDPQAAVGLYPVFVRENGEVFVETATPVSHIVVLDGPNGAPVPEWNAPDIDTVEVDGLTVDKLVDDALTGEPVDTEAKADGTWC